MVVKATHHLFNGWHFPVTASEAWVVPTMRSTSVTYTSESCIEHPSPARGLFDVFMPKTLMAGVGLDIGSEVRTFVIAHGLDPAGTGAVIDRNVAYFEGEIDGIERQASPGMNAFNVRMGDAAPLPDADVDVQFDLETGIARVTNTAVRPADVTLRMQFRIPTALDDNGVTHRGPYRGGRLRASIITGGPLEYLPPRTYYISDGVGDFTLGGGDVGPYAPGTFVWVEALLVNVGPQQEVRVMGSMIEQNRGKPDGYDLGITASDFLARLGRTSVGDEPWPYETVAGRINKQLRPAVGSLYLDSYPRRYQSEEPGGWDLVNVNFVRPLDVDHRSALDVYQRTVASLGRVALGLAGRVGMSYGLTPGNNITVTNGIAALVPDRAYTSEIPSDAVPLAPLALTTDRVATKITASWFKPGPAGVTNEYDLTELTESMSDPEGIRKYGVIDRKIETDQYTNRADYKLADVAVSLWNRMQILLAEQAEPEWYFSENPTIIPRDLDRVRGLAELIDNGTRFGRSVRFTGRVPLDMPQDHRVKGGRFGFDGGRWRMSLEVEPINFSGVDAATIARAEQRPDFTIGSGTRVTIADMRGTAL